jgi:hypothetical protein
MPENKTKATELSVDDFLNSISDQAKQDDSRVIVSLMQELTGAAPKMWGESIIGFGRTRYKYDSGREGDWFITGFSPRKQNLTLYLLPGLMTENTEMLKNLGKFKTGKGCLYINKLSDVKIDVLREIIETSIESGKNSKYFTRISD